MKPKIYIAGKISGEHYDKIYNKFNKAECELYSKNYAVINPTKIIAQDTEWQEAMRICIKELVDCDVVYALLDWKDSEGAKIEIELAKKLGIKILYQNKK